MKTNVTMKMLAFAMLLISFASCKDDDDSPKNNYTVDGSTKTIKAGYLLYDNHASTNSETGDLYYLHDIVFITDRLRLDMSNGNDVFDLQGTGNALSLVIVSATKDLEAGTFNFSTREPSETPFDFKSGSLFVNVDAAANWADALYIFTEGKITVDKIGDAFKIDVEGKVRQVDYETFFYFGSLDFIGSPVSIKVHYHGSLPKYKS